MMPNCKVCRLRHNLPAEEREALDKALRTGSNVAVATTLTRHGHPTSEAAIRRHKAHQ